MSGGHWTRFAGLAAPEDSIQDLNSEFIYRNPDLTDQLLRIGAVAHRHDGHPRLPNPRTPLTLGTSSTPGSLSADTEYFITYTVVDPWGGETMAAPGASATTGGSVPAPTLTPSAGVSHASGIMPAGNYAYAFTLTDGRGGETTLGPTEWIYIDPGFASAEVNFVGLAAMLTGGAVNWRMWRSYEGQDWHLVTQSSRDTFTDAGFDPPDNPARPPASNTTGTGATSLTATIPGSAVDPALASGSQIKVYFSTGSDFWSPSLLTTLPIACAGTTLTITSSSTSDGEPPHANLSIGGAARILGSTEVVGWQTLIASASGIASGGSAMPGSAHAQGELIFQGSGGTIVTVTDYGGGSALITISGGGGGSGSVGPAGPAGPAGADGAAGPTGPAGPPGGGGGGVTLGVGGSAASPLVTPTGYIEFAPSGGTQVGVTDLGGGSARVIISLAEGPEYVVRASGGDDYANLQGAINNAMAHSGRVTLPDPLYKTAQGLVASAYCNIFGAGMDSTKIQAASAIAGPVLDMQWSAGNKHYLVQDLTVDANSLAATGLRQYVATETSVAMYFIRVRAGNATGYQFVNHGCEDSTWIDCLVDGDESSPTTTGLAVQVVIPTGAMTMLGCTFFGACDLSYQLIEATGCTMGPLVLENSSNSSSTVLSLDGCYLYDGSTGSYACIDTPNNLTNVIAKGCYFVAQVKRYWVNGNIGPGVSIQLENCTYIWGPRTAGTNTIVQCTGTGHVYIQGYGWDIGLATPQLISRVSGSVALTVLDATGQLITPRVNSPKIFQASGGSAAAWVGGLLGFAGSGGTGVQVQDMGGGSAIVLISASGAAGPAGAAGASGAAGPVGAAGPAGTVASAATTVARAYMANLPSTFTNGWNKITLDTISFDPGGNFQITGGNHRYVCPASGYYHVDGQVLFNVEGNPEQGYVAIYKNGVRTSDGQCVEIRGGTNGDLWGGNVNDIISCAAGDTLELYFNTNVTAAGVSTGGDPVNNYLAVNQVAAPPGGYVTVGGSAMAGQIGLVDALEFAGSAGIGAAVQNQGGGSALVLIGQAVSPRIVLDDECCYSDLPSNVALPTTNIGFDANRLARTLSSGAVYIAGSAALQGPIVAEVDVEFMNGYANGNFSVGLVRADTGATTKVTFQNDGNIVGYDLAGAAKFATGGAKELLGQRYRIMLSYSELLDAGTNTPSSTQQSLAFSVREGLVDPTMDQGLSNSSTPNIVPWLIGAKVQGGQVVPVGTKFALTVNTDGTRVVAVYRVRFYRGSIR